MAEVLVRFTESVRGADGARFAAQACGGIADDGLWEGWIEFAGPGSQLLRTPRETEQPNRDALVYWAEGLSATYLEGALRRAIETRTPQPASVPASEPSMFSGPARPGVAAPMRPHSVLDPFATYMQGEGVLRQQLTALSRDHLVTLVDAYALDVGSARYGAKDELSEAIVRAVKAHSSVA